MVEVARRFISGEKPASGIVLSDSLGLPTSMAGKILQAPAGAGLLAESQQGEIAYLPARPLEKITCHDVLHALRTSRNGTVATCDDAVRASLRGHYSRFQELAKGAASTFTLAQLATESVSRVKPTV